MPGDNVAYWNKDTGVKITHFPVIHCRQGSIGYKLEWTSPHTGETLSMVYSSDTRPTRTMVEQASGIDVLVHEIVMPPDKWAMKFKHKDTLDMSQAALVLRQSCAEQLTHHTRRVWLPTDRDRPPSAVDGSHPFPGYG